MSSNLLYVWIDYGSGFEPHMSFGKSEKEEAIFEIQEIKDQGDKAKFGEAF